MKNSEERSLSDIFGTKDALASRGMTTGNVQRDVISTFRGLYWPLYEAHKYLCFGEPEESLQDQLDHALEKLAGVRFILDLLKQRARAIDVFLVHGHTVSAYDCLIIFMDDRSNMRALHGAREKTTQAINQIVEVLDLTNSTRINPKWG